MTRKFSLGLFVSMAAAAGLHVRPCWTSCLIPTFGLKPAEVVSVPMSGLDPIVADASPVDGAVQAARRGRPVLHQMWQLRPQPTPPNTLTVE